MGGRSRVAAQMLSGKGFSEVYNVSGGIKAWKDKVAVGPQTQGLDLFSGGEQPGDILKTAYSLEQGLREFYLDMAGQARNDTVRDMFEKLSDIEVKHQFSIYNAYNELQETEVSKKDFEAMVGQAAMEGGMTTDQYLKLWGADLSSEIDVISLAMSIEAQALDLYQRVGAVVDNPESKAIIDKIANEEKTHLASLGDLMDRL